MLTYEGRVATLIRSAGNYLLINALVLLSCLPVVTVGAAISAAYTTIHDNQMGERGYLLNTYLRAFKQNLGQGVRIWSVCLCVIALFAFNILYFLERRAAGYPDGTLYILFAVLLLLVVLLSFYIFAYIARFEDSAMSAVRNAGIMLLTQPVRNLKLLLLLAVFGFGILLQPLLIAVIPVLFLRLAVDTFEAIFRRYL